MSSDDNQSYEVELGLRIKETAEKFSSKADAAAAAGVTLVQFNKWIAGSVKVPVGGLRALAAGAHVNFSWLVSGVPGEVKDASNVTKVNDELQVLPRIDTTLSGGDGSFLDGCRVVDQVYFQTKWLKEKVGIVDLSKLAIVGVVGDSMEPTITQGDDLMIDLSVTSLLDNAIYAIRFDDALVVKRLQRLMDGLVVISDNPAYKDQTLDRSQVDRLQILGRVRWIGKII